jgi:ATP phosphoribosyltransferase
MSQKLTLALAKGRLLDQVLSYFSQCGITVEFEERKLIAHDREGILDLILVKNADLPTYLRYGIAGLGICGEDVLYEYGDDLVRLFEFPFGLTTMALAGKTELERPTWGPMTVATKFIRFTHNYFTQRGIPVKMVKLDGSVELAPVLGLAPYIVDLVETGSTLKAHGLKVIQELKKIKVHLVANRAYWKWNFQAIQQFIKRLSSADILR